MINRLVEADDFPSQEDVDILCNNQDFPLSPLKVNKLHEWLKNYKRVKDQVPLPEYAKTRPDVSFTAV